MVYSSSSSTTTNVIAKDDPTEAVIQRMVEAMQKFIHEEKEEGIPLSSVTKGHFQLQIKTLQNAPRDVDKLEWLLKKKEKREERCKENLLFFYYFFLSLYGSITSGNVWLNRSC